MQNRVQVTIGVSNGASQGGSSGPPLAHRRSRRLAITALLAWLGLGLSLSGESSAALVQYAFSGTIETAHADTVFAGLAGLPFTGRLVYDTDLAESASTLSDPEFAAYRPSDAAVIDLRLGLEVEIGTAAVAILEAGQIVFEVLDEGTFLGDEFFAGGTLVEGATPAEDVDLFFELLNSDGTALGSTQLPETLQLADFETARIFSPYFGGACSRQACSGTSRSSF